MKPDRITPEGRDAFGYRIRTSDYRPPKVPIGCGTLLLRIVAAGMVFWTAVLIWRAIR